MCVCKTEVKQEKGVLQLSISKVVQLVHLFRENDFLRK